MGQTEAYCIDKGARVDLGDKGARVDLNHHIIQIEAPLSFRHRLLPVQCTGAVLYAWLYPIPGR